MKDENIKQKTKRTTMNLAIWTSAWVISMAIANFGSLLIWPQNTILTVLAIILNLGIGVGMIYANINFLMSQDEMQQRIQLEAMGITLGIGLICGLAYSNLATTKIIPFHAEISHLVILMSITYLITTYIGVKKYQ